MHDEKCIPQACATTALCTLRPTGKPFATKSTFIGVDWIVAKAQKRNQSDILQGPYDLVYRWSRKGCELLWPRRIFFFEPSRSCACS